jgi:hypothetical protein
MMVGGVSPGLPDLMKGNAMQYLMGLIALVGVFLIVLGFLRGSGILVTIGAIIVLLALVMLILMAILGVFAAAKEGVETVRQAKDLVDEVVPGAIPFVQNGVRRGMDIVQGRASTAPPPRRDPYLPTHQVPPHQPRPDVPLYHACPTCGAGNRPGDAYCHYCKRPIYWEVSRGGPER